MADNLMTPTGVQEAQTPSKPGGTKRDVMVEQTVNDSDGSGQLGVKRMRLSEATASTAATDNVIPSPSALVTSPPLPSSLESAEPSPPASDDQMDEKVKEEPPDADATDVRPVPQVPLQNAPDIPKYMEPIGFATRAMSCRPSFREPVDIALQVSDCCKIGPLFDDALIRSLPPYKSLPYPEQYTRIVQDLIRYAHYPDIVFQNLKEAVEGEPSTTITHLHAFTGQFECKKIPVVLDSAAAKAWLGDLLESLGCCRRLFVPDFLVDEYICKQCISWKRVELEGIQVKNECEEEKKRAEERERKRQEEEESERQRVAEEQRKEAEEERQKRNALELEEQRKSEAEAKRQEEERKAEEERQRRADLELEDQRKSEAETKRQEQEEHQIKEEEPEIEFKQEVKEQEDAPFTPASADPLEGEPATDDDAVKTEVNDYQYSQPHPTECVIIEEPIVLPTATPLRRRSVSSEVAPAVLGGDAEELPGEEGVEAERRVRWLDDVAQSNVEEMKPMEEMVALMNSRKAVSPKSILVRRTPSFLKKRQKKEERKMAEAEKKRIIRKIQESLEILEGQGWEVQNWTKEEKEQRRAERAIEEQMEAEGYKKWRELRFYQKAAAHCENVMEETKGTTEKLTKEEETFKEMWKNEKEKIEKEEEKQKEAIPDDSAEVAALMEERYYNLNAFFLTHFPEARSEQRPDLDRDVVINCPELCHQLRVVFTYDGEKEMWKLGDERPMDASPFKQVTTHKCSGTPSDLYTGGGMLLLWWSLRRRCPKCTTKTSLDTAMEKAKLFVEKERQAKTSE